MKILLRNKPKRSSILSRVPARWTFEFRLTTIYLNASAYKIDPFENARNYFFLVKIWSFLRCFKHLLLNGDKLKKVWFKRRKNSINVSFSPNQISSSRATSILKEITKLKHLSLARIFVASVFGICHFKVFVQCRDQSKWYTDVK